ncbi:MAG: hypothetical protein PHD61_03985 [Bacteroidales bacterium]|nr:hypothetical protein [Lentimicrobiaceae bacterium]MDD5694448.1 hypothetical protein [Bacteroidales bacterium]
MKEVDGLISRIYLKIRKLIETLEELKAENTRLTQSETELKTLIEQQTNTIHTLEEKLNQVTANPSAGNQGIDSARKQISGIVREIDKCISLLNK